MNRRDFVRLRVRGDERVLELSCERLYMAYVDAESSVGRGLAEAAAGGSVGEPTDPPWTGEPPTQMAARTSDEVFAELDRRLAAACTLRVVGMEWLAEPIFRARVERVIEAFRRRGGRVEPSGPSASVS